MLYLFYHLIPDPFIFMQESNNSNALHWILGASLLLIALFVVIALVNVKSQADNVSTSATITNSSPTISAVYITAASSTTLVNDATMTPSSGANKTIWITGTIADNNGDSDITAGTGKVRVAFYESGTTCDPDDALNKDNNNCYKSSTANDATNTDGGGVACSIDSSTGTSLTATFTCPITLAFYADATVAGGVNAAGNWVAKVKVLDAASAFAVDFATTTEMQLQTSLSIGASIAYGELALGVSNTSTNNAALLLTQYGNDEATVSVTSATAMACTIGTIPVGNQQWALTDIDYDAVGTNALTTSAAPTSVLVPYRTDDASATQSNKYLYWDILIPTTGVGGSCTGTDVLATSAY